MLIKGQEVWIDKKSGCPIIRIEPGLGIKAGDTVRLRQYPGTSWVLIDKRRGKKVIKTAILEKDGRYTVDRTVTAMEGKGLKIRLVMDAGIKAGPACTKQIDGYVEITQNGEKEL